MKPSEIIIAIAKRHVGLVGDVPAFQALLGELQGASRWPLDLPFGKGGISTCAVVGRGFARLLGVPLGAYVSQSGLSDLIAYARSKGAWITDRNVCPPLGSIVELNGKNSIHVLTVISIVRTASGVRIISVDGGQVAANGLQTITMRTRTWTPGALDGTPIVGFVDVDRPGFVAATPLYPPEPAPDTGATGFIVGTFAAVAAWLLARKGKR